MGLNRRRMPIRSVIALRLAYGSLAKELQIFGQSTTWSGGGKLSNKQISEIKSAGNHFVTKYKEIFCPSATPFGGERVK